MIDTSKPTGAKSTSTTANTAGPSTETDVLAGRAQSKKRRIPGACDICKRKKIRLRCDSGEMPDNRCSNCTQFGLECTHKEVTKVRVPPLERTKRVLARTPPPLPYVESLEARLEKMDRLLSKLLPGIDIAQAVEDIKPAKNSRSPSSCSNDSSDSSSEEAAAGDNNLGNEMLTMRLDRLNLNPQANRFFGKSRQAKAYCYFGYQLVQTALDLKLEYTGEASSPRLITNANEARLPLRRHEFWDVPPWLKSNPELENDVPSYIYPPEDLMPSLIDAYFTQMNNFLPLLHRPTFERSIANGLHYTDSMFGATVLLVCAHGARYSNDPRVRSERAEGELEGQRSAGWKWFEQVNVLRKTLFKRTTLYELQMQALHVLFAQSSETPQGIWAQIGLAVRLSQEVGAHRRRRKKDAHATAEDELWKRAFWVIMSLDRQISSFSGRPCGLQDEDLDVDLPVECDDEYWDKGFRQPPDKPSTITYFNCYLRLMDIMAYAMRLIYSIKRPGSKTGRSDQKIIAELDAAMNSWMDSVPDHLRWNPNCKNELFLKQSAALHATYYHLQILIHRPFIPSPRNPTPVAFPSLAICTNAARSCCHVLESFSKLSAVPFATLQTTAFTAAVILLLNIWSGKRSGYAPNPRREMEDVQRCMDVLKASETKWAAAGRFRDILTELAFAGDLSLPVTPSANGTGSSSSPVMIRKKRARDTDETAEGPKSAASSSPTSPVDPQPRAIAGTRRVSMSTTQQPQINAIPQAQIPHQNAPVAPLNFALPMYSNELGRLPIYGQFSFTDTLGSNPCIPIQPPTSLDQILLSSFASRAAASAAAGVGGTAGAMPTTTPRLDAYVIDALFRGQTIENLVRTANAQWYLNQQAAQQLQQQHQNSMQNLQNIQQAGLSNIGGSMSQVEGLSGGPSLELSEDVPMSMIGTMPAMDHDTMTMWSMAPTSLELDDWHSYISSVEQITQGYN
ncbi:fungal-specific transcription factor domain-containing protein [Panaeolus papilionaceus]|nr:fungal-specific transcription factor domain-containing protein [Panaeolus papilionaceus]